MSILSVDLNSFGHRATLLGPDGRLLKHYLPAPKTSAGHWLARVLAEHRGLTVVGSPLDDWPGEVLAAVEEAGARLEWLSPGLMKRLFSVCRPWNLQRKLHRARFLGHLYVSRATIWDAEAVTRDFERRVARAILSDGESETFGPEWES